MDVARGCDLVLEGDRVDVFVLEGLVGLLDNQGDGIVALTTVGRKEVDVGGGRVFAVFDSERKESLLFLGQFLVIPFLFHCWVRSLQSCIIIRFRSRSRWCWLLLLRRRTPWIPVILIIAILARRLGIRVVVTVRGIVIDRDMDIRVGLGPRDRRCLVRIMLGSGSKDCGEHDVDKEDSSGAEDDLAEVEAAGETACGGKGVG